MTKSLRSLTVATAIVVLSIVTISIITVTLANAADPVPTAPVTKIDINTATAEEFQKMFRVGVKLSIAIVADREANGPFKSIDELVRVMRIGEKIIEQNRSMLTISTPKGQ